MNDDEDEDDDNDKDDVDDPWDDDKDDDRFLGSHNLGPVLLIKISCTTILCILYGTLNSRYIQ